MPNTFDPTKDLKDAMKLAQSPAGQQLPGRGRGSMFGKIRRA